MFYDTRLFTVRFRGFRVVLVAAAVALVGVGAHATTLEDVVAAGELTCGINTGVPGFAFTDDTANVQRLARGTDHPEINRMLGSEGSFGAMLGLDAQWAVRAIAAEGNYAEIFDRYIGPDTRLGLQRGLNALYKDGGILYAPPFR